jgi:hypothetical protein
MTTVTISFVNQTQGGELLVREYKCKDTLGKPSFPMWPMPLLDGRVAVVNLAMAYDIVLEESQIKTPDSPARN